MAFAAESPQAITELLRWRHLAVIPRDQQRLLENEDSWAVELRDKPHGSGQVPGVVLKTVKEAYTRHRRPDRGTRRQSPPHRNGASIAIGGGDGNVDHEPELPHLSPQKTRSTMPSSPERSIPWSSSPNRAKGQSRSPAAVMGSRSLGSPSRDRAPPSNASTPKLPTLRISTPGDVPRLVPTSRSSTQLIAAPAYAFPSSCDDEEDMKIERPPIQHHDDVEMKNAAAPGRVSNALTSSAITTNTPPCGQREETSIPNTVRKPTEHQKSLLDEAKRKTRRMKPIIFSDDSPGPMRPATVPATVVRMPSTKDKSYQELLDTTHFSSMVPATFRDPGPHLGNGIHQDPRWQLAHIPTYYKGVEEDTSTSSQDSPEPVGPLTAITGHQDPAVTETHGRLSKSLQFSTGTRPANIQIPRSIPQATTKDKAKAPYQAFITVYPDYVTDHSGNLWDFIAACVYIEHVQEMRQLREYLYDDFIRAWSSGFLQYVHDAGPGQEPIPAIEWYNRILGPILFNRMSVRKDNLELVLSSYPEEAARARYLRNRALGAQDGAGDKMRPTPPRVPVRDHLMTDISNVPQGQEEEEVVEEEEEEEIEEPPETQPAILIQDSPSPPLTSRAASPDLGHDMTQTHPEPGPKPVHHQPIQPPTPLPPPSSAASLSKRLPNTPLWNTLSSAAPSSSARSENKVRKRSAAERERLREHFRKRRSAGSAFSGSGRA